MIISDHYQFLYVANLKTASTSLHSALRPVASVYIDETGVGKHWTLGQIYREYGSARIGPLFKWAVVREPTAYFWSLYLFHKRPAFDGKHHSTAGKTFEEFYRGDAHGWMKVPQSSRFEDADGDYGLDFLITMDHLSEGYAYLRFRLGLPTLLLPLLNTTGAEMDVPDRLRDQIRDDYAADYEFIERYGNRERTPGGWHNILDTAGAARQGAQ